MLCICTVYTYKITPCVMLFKIAFLFYYYYLKRKKFKKKCKIKKKNKYLHNIYPCICIHIQMDLCGYNMRKR